MTRDVACHGRWRNERAPLRTASRVRPGPGRPVDAGDHRSAATSRARSAHALAEIRRPARPRAHHGALDGARRTRTPGGRRCARSGALALAATVGTALQPVGCCQARKADARSVKRAAGRHRGRRRNVQGAFRVPAERKAEVAGRRLILIDDVLTSGATSDACARTLLRAGARSVDLLVFARVVDAVRAPI